MPRADRIQIVGTFERHDQASAALRAAGDVAIVYRGIPRMMVVRCPCDCGDNLVINLDRRAGKAWRLYDRGSGLSLFPSYWRDTACESHFVLWCDRLFWCDWEGLRRRWGISFDMQAKVGQALGDKFEPYEVIAERIDEVPWEVLIECRSLVAKGVAEEDTSQDGGQFRRRM